MKKDILNKSRDKGYAIKQDLKPFKTITLGDQVCDGCNGYISENSKVGIWPYQEGLNINCLTYCKDCMALMFHDWK